MYSCDDQRTELEKNKNKQDQLQKYKLIISYRVLTKSSVSRLGAVLGAGAGAGTGGTFGEAICRKQYMSINPSTPTAMMELTPRPVAAVSQPTADRPSATQ